MAGNAPVSLKRVLIDKANARIVVWVSVAAFILVFSLVATKTLISQGAYQNRVIAKKRAAVTQLRSDIDATGSLKTAYKAFTGGTTNAIGGLSGGNGLQDGNNAKLVLDALPSNYDFPGLTTSLETLLRNQSVKIENIGGVDDEVAQGANQTSINPQPVPMPFTIKVEGDYTAIQNVIGAFEHSIRPIQLQSVRITTNGVAKDKLTLEIVAQTYYQPAKSLSIKKEAVK